MKDAERLGEHFSKFFADSVDKTFQNCLHILKQVINTIKTM